jgi:hypothetical protein
MVSKLLLSLLLLVPIAYGQQCTSSAASDIGNWKPLTTAPHDGTVVEVLNTYGIAPTYSLMKFTREHPAESDWTQKPWKSENPEWVEIAPQPNNNEAIMGTECFYWRPYKGDPKKYVDPTNGAQMSIAYWCLAMHRPYNKKTGYCN